MEKVYCLGWLGVRRKGQEQREMMVSKSSHSDSVIPFLDGSPKEVIDMGQTCLCKDSHRNIITAKNGSNLDVQ